MLYIIIFTTYSHSCCLSLSTWADTNAIGEYPAIKSNEDLARRLEDFH